MDLLACHALRFDDHVGVFRADKADDDVASFFPIARPVDRRTCLSRIFREPLEILIEMKQGFVFDRPRSFAQTFPIASRSDRVVAADDKTVREMSQRSVQNGISER